MAHEEIISETPKNYVTSSNKLNKKNSYDGIWNLGQKQKHVQYKRFSVLHRYIFSALLTAYVIDIYSQHTYISLDINIIITSAYFAILTSVIF